MVILISDNPVNSPLNTSQTNGGSFQNGEGNITLFYCYFFLLCNMVEKTETTTMRLVWYIYERCKIINLLLLVTHLCRE